MSKFYQATNVGLVRKQNEDSLIVFEPETYVVADGMGGQAAGEIASQMLVDIVQKTLTEHSLPWNEHILKSAILKANEAIMNEAKEHEEYSGMGTTATILHIENKIAYYAHVGDSRLYRLKNGEFKQMTIDHSYVEELVRNGELTEAEARVHPMKNILTQAVGVVADIDVNIGNFNVDSGDVFLLCTDGLTNMVSNEKIANIIKSSENPAESLIDAALRNGGKDNVTVIVLGII